MRVIYAYSKNKNTFDTDSGKHINSVKWVIETLVNGKIVL